MDRQAEGRSKFIFADPSFDDSQSESFLFTKRKRGAGPERDEEGSLQESDEASISIFQPSRESDSDEPREQKKVARFSQRLSGFWFVPVASICFLYVLFFVSDSLSKKRVLDSIIRNAVFNGFIALHNKLPMIECLPNIYYAPQVDSDMLGTEAPLSLITVCKNSTLF